MIFEANAPAFLACLKQAATVIPAKSPIPLLGMVKVVTNDDRVTIIGTDMDRSIEIDLPAEIATEGAWCLPLATLAQFVTAARKGRIKVAVAEGTAKLSSGRSRISLHAIPIEDFPDLRPAEMDAVDMDPVTLLRALAFAAAAMSNEEARPYLRGVYVKSQDDGLHIVGTDGYGLHFACLPSGPEMGPATVPSEAILNILKLAAKASVTRFAATPDGWRFEMDGLRIWGRCLQDKYPDYARIVSGAQGGHEVAITDAENLTAALTVASCGAETRENKNRDIVIRATDGGPVVMLGRAQANGVVHAGRAEIEGAGAGDMAGAFASRFIGRAFDQLAGETLRVESAAGGGIIRILPAQAGAALHREAIIQGILASPEELADVA